MEKGLSHEQQRRRRQQEDEDEDCCVKSPSRAPHQSTTEALFHQLAIVIKARHLQLGGYSHDEHEHLLQARQLLEMGHDSQARLEVHLALQKRAIHARESLKYRNLVALRDTLQEAQRNLTLAQVMKEGNTALQERLNGLSKADLLLLQQQHHQQKRKESVSEPLLVEMSDGASAADEAGEEEESLPTVTEEEVATQLALLRLPATPTGGSNVERVPMAAREAICK